MRGRGGFSRDFAGIPGRPTTERVGCAAGPVAGAARRAAGTWGSAAEAASPAAERLGLEAGFVYRTGRCSEWAFLAEE